MRARPCVVCKSPIPLTRPDRYTCGSTCRQTVARARRDVVRPAATKRTKIIAEKVLSSLAAERLIRYGLSMGMKMENGD
jgi:predicted nucleic acid-binding Zn ribbon protein